MNWRNGFALLGGPSSFSPLRDHFIFGVASPTTSEKPTKKDGTIFATNGNLLSEG
jgi:hypothetical protein